MMTDRDFVIPQNSNHFFAFWRNNEKCVFFDKYLKKLNRRMIQRGGDAIKKWSEYGYDRRVASIMLYIFCKQCNLVSSNVWPDDPLFWYTFCYTDEEYLEEPSESHIGRVTALPDVDYVEGICKRFGVNIIDFGFAVIGVDKGTTVNWDEKFNERYRVVANKISMGMFFDFLISHKAKGALCNKRWF